MKPINILMLAILVFSVTMLLIITFDGKSGSIYSEYKSTTEQINTLEDLKEWIQWDIEEHKIDSLTGVIYIKNIEGVLESIKQQNNDRH